MESNVTISWVEFDVNNDTTWPKDDQEKIVTVIRGEDGIPETEGMCGSVCEQAVTHGEDADLNSGGNGKDEFYKIYA